MQAILQGLTGNDNEVRLRAEESLSAGLQSHPNDVILALCAECGNPDSVALQGLAIVLIRNRLTQDESLWTEKFSPATKEQLKSQLLRLLDSPQMSNASNRRKLCDTIAVIAAHADGDWPDLLPYLFRSAQPQCTVVQKENALELFSNLAQFIQDKVENNLSHVTSLLSNLMVESEAKSVRLGATRAAWDLVLNSENHTVELYTQFTPLIDLSLHIVSTCLQEPRVEETFECFIDLATSEGSRKWFSKQRLERTLHTMLTIASHSSTSSEIRILAMECIVCLMESRGGAIRKLQPKHVVVQQCIPVLVQMMTSLPDFDLNIWGNRYPANFTSSTASFHAEDQDDCEGDMESFGASLEYVDRITSALKSVFVLPLFFQCCGQLLQSTQNDWRYPHAGLLWIAHIVEFMDKKEPELKEICTLACTHATQHSHMRVRHAGFTLIGRIALDCAPQVQERHAQLLLSAIMIGLKDSVPRVQAHASVALVNYTFGIEGHFDTGLKPFLPQVLQTLFECLGASQNEFVQENIISGVAHVAKCAGEDFSPFYAQALSPLKMALERLPPGEKYGLRARLVDCISLIGLSVGKEQFAPDAVWLMSLLQQTELDAEDENVAYVQMAWTRLSEVLEDSLGPYLPLIVPFVLETCNRDNLRENEDLDDEGGGHGEEDKAALKLVRTAAVDDRLAGLDTLSRFALFCKHAFWPFFSETWKVFSRDVHECELECVRELAAEGLPDLVHCLVHSRPFISAQEYQHFLHLMLSLICVSAPEEESFEVLHKLVLSLRLILDCVSIPEGDACPDYVETCGMLLMELLKESMQRRAVEMAKFKCDQLEEEADGDVEQDFRERVSEEHDLQLSISATMGALIKANPRSFISNAMLSQVGNHVFELANANRLCHDQKVAVFILDDVLEFCPVDVSSPLYARMVDVLLRTVNCDRSTSKDESQAEVAQLVQGAAYGLGVCAERFGVLPPQVETSLVNLLTKMPKDLVAQEPTYGYCLDNVASALLKLARRRNDNALWPIWLNALPLTFDLQESRINSLALIKMLDEERSPYFQQEEVVGKVIGILARVIGTEYLEDCHMDRAIALLQAIQTHVGMDFFKRHVSPQELQRIARITQ